MRKILIVDDQPEVRELVRVTLEIGNYKILAAENGQQALEVARAEHPDIILLDLKMPGSSVTGLEVCRRLKNDRETANIYIIIIYKKHPNICTIPFWRRDDETCNIKHHFSIFTISFSPP